MFVYCNVFKGAFMKSTITKENIKIIQEFIKQGYTLSMLGKEYKIHPSSMGRALNKLGINYNLEIEKIEKNEGFFEQIDSELKAYLLGFFVADGCVYDASRFGLCIAEQDTYIVELFRKAISPKSKIKYIHNTKNAKNRQRQLMIRISSKKLVNDLIKYGIVSRKTFKPIHLPNINNELKWHFVRGYFDGDGYLGKRKLKQYNTCRISLSNGDKTILEDIKQFTNIGTLRQQGNCWRLDIENILNCKEFLDNLYKNCNYYLPRKYNKFLEVNAEVFAVSKKIANSVTHRD